MEAIALSEISQAQKTRITPLSSYMETKSGWWKVEEGLVVAWKRDQEEEGREEGGEGKRRVGRHDQCLEIS